MSEFKHSITLFTSFDDGLPLMFNIRNVVEKETLKAMIEHGGGFYTLSDDAIHLVSRGTKVLNVDNGKNLISSQYIFDCVNQNNLLNMDEYAIKINEVETSDISDEDSKDLMEKPMYVEHEKSENPYKKGVDILEIDETTYAKGETVSVTASSLEVFSSADAIDNSKNDANNQVCDATFVHNEVTVEMENQNLSVDDSNTKPNRQNEYISDKHVSMETSLNNYDRNVSVLPDSPNDSAELIKSAIEDGTNNIAIVENFNNRTVMQDDDFMELTKITSPVGAIVSSSQPPAEELDGFDNLVLNKLKEKPVQEPEDSLSQSYTVSSSQDAQHSSKPSPAKNTSADLFARTSSDPDCAVHSSQPSEREAYIQELEAEVEQILQKPSPRSIQDKIVLVKYICCVKKLPPATVLQTLQNL